MPNDQFSKIRDIGRLIPVWLVHSRAAVVPVYAGGLFSPAVMAASSYSPYAPKTGRHSFATAPTTWPRGVPIARVKRKRQSHFDMSMGWNCEPRNAHEYGDSTKLEKMKL
jgi:hypothetical protein